MLEARPLTQLELSKNGFSDKKKHLALTLQKHFPVKSLSHRQGKSGNSKSGNVKSQNCKASIRFCITRFGNRGRLLQLFQARTSCCDLCQAFFQLFGRGLLLQSAAGCRSGSGRWEFPLERVKLRRRPQSVEQCLRLLVLQEFVVRAPCVHCSTIGCDCSRTSSDCSDGTSTKCINIQQVLNGYGFCSDLQKTKYPPSQKIGMGGLHRFTL